MFTRVTDASKIGVRASRPATRALERAAHRLPDEHDASGLARGARDPAGRIRAPAGAARQRTAAAAAMDARAERRAAAGIAAGSFEPSAPTRSWYNRRKHHGRSARPSESRPARERHHRVSTRPADRAPAALARAAAQRRLHDAGLRGLGARDVFQQGARRGVRHHAERAPVGARRGRRLHTRRGRDEGEGHAAPGRAARIPAARHDGAGTEENQRNEPHARAVRARNAREHPPRVLARAACAATIWSASSTCCWRSPTSRRRATLLHGVRRRRRGARRGSGRRARRRVLAGPRPRQGVKPESPPSASIASSSRR